MGFVAGGGCKKTLERKEAPHSIISIYKDIQVIQPSVDLTATAPTSDSLYLNYFLSLLGRRVLTI